MAPIIKSVLLSGLLALTASCADQGADQAHSTPIDSSNVRGTAPVTYGGEDPANLQDTQLRNSNDTGTTATSVSNTGDPEDQVKNPVKK